MIILIGESGSGKTTILEELVKKGYKKAINYTTRQKRQGEEEVTDLYFVSKEEFEKMWESNELLQRAEFNNEYYGLSIDSLKEDIVCISITDSVKDIEEKIIELNKQDMPVTVFYIYVSPEERTKRMLKRGDTIVRIQERMVIDKEKFKEAKEVADYVVENKDLDKAVEDILRKSKVLKNVESV